MPHGELTAKKWLDSIEKEKKKKQFKFFAKIAQISLQQIKIEEQRFVVFVMENWWPRNGSIPSRNEEEKAMFVTNGHANRQSPRQKIVDS